MDGITLTDMGVGWVLLPCDQIGADAIWTKNGRKLTKNGLSVFLRVLNWRTKIELKITYFACNKGGSKFILACPLTDMPLSGGWVGGLDFRPDRVMPSSHLLRNPPPPPPPPD